MARSSLVSVVRALGLSIALAAQVAAQGPLAGQPIRPQPEQPLRFEPQPLDGPGAFEPLPARGASIVGIVQNHLGRLVPSAGTVALRSLTTGEIVSRTQVDGLAQFSFKGVEPDLYVAELVGHDGSLLATSHAFSAVAGQVIQLAAIVPAQGLTGLAALLANVSTAVVTTAAAAGILAIDPGEPVSPR